MNFVTAGVWGESVAGYGTAGWVTKKRERSGPGRAAGGGGAAGGTLRDASCSAAWKDVGGGRRAPDDAVSVPSEDSDASETSDTTTPSSSPSEGRLDGTTDEDDNDDAREQSGRGGNVRRP